MKISIKAKPKAREDSIEKIDENNFIVSVKELPIQGRANRAIIGILAEYFNITPSSIRIVSGHNSRHKIIEIE